MVIRSKEELQQLLLEEQTRLRSQLKHGASRINEHVGYGNHMADDATEAFEQAKDLALRQNAQQLLTQITDALERFRQGNYGICEQCGAEIDPARLTALPYATLCLRCQQRQKKI